jgi:hypothetical protein
VGCGEIVQFACVEESSRREVKKAQRRGEVYAKVCGNLTIAIVGFCMNLHAGWRIGVVVIPSEQENPRNTR